ncbi:hypothetical protein DR64_6059 [Paraburkholderia xenovorans LB400]|uniref:hypothetical protein n=1 Tax=Paraburkholderia xenovorans TaxID=36873 RepID=UPI0002F9FECC|nr:hypothetical protein [Paraburkholderia xenovorans]AIP36456.1 hypothetical protein DR64_6059 [Paraburkholderia xenovorans LB400]
MELFKALRALRTLPGAFRRGARYSRDRLHGACLSRIPLRAIEPLAISAWYLRSRFNARLRWSGIERREVGRDVLKLEHIDARRVLPGRVLERLIDQRLHFGRQRNRAEAWPDLQRAASALAQIIRKVKAATPGRPVIVSPFHYVSQYANIYLIDELRKQLGLASIGVVSGVPQNIYGSDEAMIPHIDILHTYSETNRSGLGLRAARSLKRNGVVVLFSDAPPFTLSGYPMETVGVSLFGRPARIHNGVFRMGAPLDALLLPFYLRFEHGRFDAVVFDPLELARSDAPQRVADCIEKGLRDNYSRSLVAGHPSMYAFAPAR